MDKDLRNAVDKVNELLEGFDRLPGLHQTVGKLGARLRRCKSSSPLAQWITDEMTKLDNEASEIRSGIRLRLFGMLYRSYQENT